MTVAAFCGTFSPITLGHLDVIERASLIFEKIIVLVSPNSEKVDDYSENQRCAWIKEACAHLDNVEVYVQSGLSVVSAKEHGASVLIRGIRTVHDFEYEKNMSSMNKLISGDMDTLCIFSKDEYSTCSSSNVRELLKYKQDIRPLVPECVARDLMR